MRHGIGPQPHLNSGLKCPMRRMARPFHVLVPVARGVLAVLRRDDLTSDNSSRADCNMASMGWPRPAEPFSGRPGWLDWGAVPCRTNEQVSVARIPTNVIGRSGSRPQPKPWTFALGQMHPLRVERSTSALLLQQPYAAPRTSSPSGHNPTPSARSQPLTLGHARAWPRSSHCVRP